MLVSEQWLREWVNPDIDIEMLSHVLTQCGLEVESFVPVAPDFSGVVVGHVLACEQHPNADKLSCCKVDLGQETVDIVCGASNVRTGLKVPVATVGAVLPGDFKIKKAKLRGEPSCGMICAAKELGIEEESSQDGIMELPEDAPVGTDFRKYLNLADRIIDVALTPNRGDCASVQGIAREVAAATEFPLSLAPTQKQKASSPSTFPVSIEAQTACPRYVGRVLTGINSAAVTPLWMQERLRRSGLRAIHPVVDVTNYVMLELGQPMHAFDLMMLQGGVSVRYARNGETLDLLDESSVELDNKTLVIADEKGPQALAGVMGGQASAVTDRTKDLFLEAAFFDPIHVRQAASQYQLQTDSSYRFERGVDFALQEVAMERASALLVDIVGGELGPITALEIEKPVVSSITLRREQVARTLGVALPDKVISNCLERLGITLKATKSGWIATPPTFRFDLTIEVDLIEEIARIYGYDRIDETAMSAPTHIVSRPREQATLSTVKFALINHGYSEVVTYSFVDPGLQSVLTDGDSGLTLSNPLSPELSEMRKSLWPGLIRVLKHNLNRQVERHRYFETGVCFLPEGESHQEVGRLALLLSGSSLPEQWGGKARPSDFFDLKGDIEHLASRLGFPSSQSWVVGQHHALHPGHQAEWTINGKTVGYLGVLHPALTKRCELTQSPVLFECDLVALRALGLPSYQAVSKFPQVRRDLALVVADNLPVGTIISTLREKSDNLLNDITIFDVYSGKGVPDGKKSIALGLTFQHASRTLKDSEIIQRIQDVVAILEREFNATIRE